MVNATEECLPIFGCLHSRKALEARELTLESEAVPEHRVSLESNERNFLSLDRLDRQRRQRRYRRPHD
jgi:hypothetical protein